MVYSYYWDEEETEHQSSITETTKYNDVLQRSVWNTQLNDERAVEEWDQVC